MSIELSTPVKIVALVGFVLVAGAAASLLLLQRHSTTTPTPVVVSRTPSHAHPATRTHATPAKPSAPQLVAGLPAPLVSALSRSKVVVAVVWSSGDPVASDLLTQARQGAKLARSPLVVLDVGHDKVAGQTATWMSGKIVEPAVLVVTRPGAIAVELDGYADKLAVAQAVVNSRS
jgi:hypothetical protein